MINFVAERILNRRVLGRVGRALRSWYDGYEGRSRGRDRSGHGILNASVPFAPLNRASGPKSVFNDNIRHSVVVWLLYGLFCSHVAFA